MPTLDQVVDSITKECISRIAEAEASIGGPCNPEQINNIVESVCTNRDHETDAAVREDVLVGISLAASLKDVPEPIQ